MMKYTVRNFFSPKMLKKKVVSNVKNTITNAKLLSTFTRLIVTKIYINECYLGSSKIFKSIEYS